MLIMRACPQTLVDGHTGTGDFVHKIVSGSELQVPIVLHRKERPELLLHPMTFNYLQVILMNLVLMLKLSIVEYM